MIIRVFVFRNLDDVADEVMPGSDSIYELAADAFSYGPDSEEPDFTITETDLVDAIDPQKLVHFVATHPEIAERALHENTTVSDFTEYITPEEGRELLDEVRWLIMARN